MDVKPEHLLWAVGLFLLWRGGVAVAAGASAAGDAVQGVYSGTVNSVTDFFAWATGLDEHQRRILEDDDYRRIHMALE